MGCYRLAENFLKKITFTATILHPQARSLSCGVTTVAFGSAKERYEHTFAERKATFICMREVERNNDCKSENKRRRLPAVERAA